MGSFSVHMPSECFPLIIADEGRSFRRKCKNLRYLRAFHLRESAGNIQKFSIDTEELSD